jgi:hypothetical protein
MRQIFNKLDATPPPFDCTTAQASYAANCVQIAAAQSDIDAANVTRNAEIALKGIAAKSVKTLQDQIEPLSQSIIDNNNLIKTNEGTISKNQTIIQNNQEGNPLRVAARKANVTLKATNKKLAAAVQTARETRAPLRKDLNAAQAEVQKHQTNIDAQEEILADKLALKESLKSNNAELAKNMAAATPPCAVTTC